MDCRLSLKNYQFSRFWGLSVDIFKATVEKFGMRVQSWETLPHARLGKNPLRGHWTLWHKLLPKNTNFGDFGVCKPTFLKPKGLNLALGCGLLTLSPVQNIVKIA